MTLMFGILTFFGCVLGVAFLSWVLYRVHHIVQEMEKTITNQQTDAPLFPCVFGKRFSALQLTMRFTVWAVALWLLYFVIWTLWVTLLLSLCQSCAVERAVFFTANLLWFAAYALMFFSHFERLRLTFTNTNMELPHFAPNVLYALLSVTFPLCVVAFALWMTKPLVSVLCASVVACLYFAAVVWLVRAFFTKTVAIAKNAQHGKRLIQVAVRITVVVTVSVLSTTLVVLLWVVSRLLLDYWYFMTLSDALKTLDICVNALCLLCTFKRAQGCYQRVFGSLDALFLKRLLPATEQPPVGPEMFKVQSISTDVLDTATR